MKGFLRDLGVLGFWGFGGRVHLQSRQRESPRASEVVAAGEVGFEDLLKFGSVRVRVGEFVELVVFENGELGVGENDACMLVQGSRCEVRGGGDGVGLEGCGVVCQEDGVSGPDGDWRGAWVLWGGRPAGRGRNKRPQAVGGRWGEKERMEDTRGQE